MSDYLYENERFFVDVELDAEDVIEREGATYDDYYIVVNKLSGIVEFKTASLLEAISGAAMNNATLESEPWKFYSRAAEGDDADFVLPGENPLVN